MQDALIHVAVATLQEKGGAGCLIWEGSFSRLQEKGGKGSCHQGRAVFDTCSSVKPTHFGEALQSAEQSVVDPTEGRARIHGWFLPASFRHLPAPAYAKPPNFPLGPKKLISCRKKEEEVVVQCLGGDCFT